MISQKSGSTGRFTFTAAESGEHRLCFQTSGAGGWFSSSHVKLHLDLAVGETGDIDRGSKEKSESLAQRVQDLNARLQDIRREQVFQRVHFPQALSPHMPETVLRGGIWIALTWCLGEGGGISGSE